MLIMPFWFVGDYNLWKSPESNAALEKGQVKTWSAASF